MKKINLINTQTINKNIYVIELSNPSKRNPLSLSLLKILQKELDSLKKNKTIKVVIIQSTGPSFSSGHDLKEVRSTSSSSKKLLNLFKVCSKLMLSIRKLPQPVIASVDGVAAAAGCQLVASCDLAFASKSSFFQTPGVNIGLFCSTPMVAISRKILPKDMMYMLLTGDKISAKAAQEMKLINKVFSKKSLKSEVLKIASMLSEKSNQSIIIGKEAFYQQLDMQIEEAYKYTSMVMTKNMALMDAKEGINAFLEKRKPKWKTN